TVHLEVHIVHGNEPKEFLGQSACLNNKVVGLRHKHEL
ncbi:MAG: hypothetical protein RLZZ290_1444, partial [Pseudomonadota bacterium]